VFFSETNPGDDSIVLQNVKGPDSPLTRQADDFPLIDSKISLKNEKVAFFSPEEKRLWHIGCFSLRGSSPSKFTKYCVRDLSEGEKTAA